MLWSQYLLLDMKSLLVERLGTRDSFPCMWYSSARPLNG